MEAPELSGPPSVLETEQFRRGAPAFTSDNPVLSQADGFATELRCRDCGNLRHSSPKHKPGCRRAGENCPGCVYPGEAHLVSCAIGVQLKHPHETCCAGVDMPSVGVVHAHDCPLDRPVWRASRTCAPAAVETVSDGEGRAGDGIRSRALDSMTVEELSAALAIQLAKAARRAAEGGAQ